VAPSILGRDTVEKGAERTKLRIATQLAGLAFLILATPVPAQDIGTPDPDVIEGLYPGKTYSPYHPS
jgi:hypothetical protein